MGNKRRHMPPPSDSEGSDEDAMGLSDDEMLGTSDSDDFQGEDDQDTPGEAADQDEAGPGPGSQAAAAAAGGALRRKKGSQKPDREPIYDTEGMHDKLEDFGWEAGVWEDTQAITGDDPTQVQDVDDDIGRELAFYTQALQAAQQAIVHFQDKGTPWLRPTDYYAEMVKTDQHMAKVKEQLMFEQRSIEQAEERRKQREAKQYSKQVQAEKLKERTANKKKAIEDVSKLRKQRVKSGFAGELDYDAEMSAMDRDSSGRGGRGDRGGRGGRGGRGMRDRGDPAGGRGGATNKKRMARNAKFGHGGVKRLAKQNDAYSAASMDGFRAGKGASPSRGGRGGSGRGRGSGRGGGGGRGGGFGGRGGGPGDGPSRGGRPSPGGVKKQAMKRPGKNARASAHRGRGR